jgi:hypothetical protein
MISHVVAQDQTHYMGLPALDIKNHVAEWLPYGDLHRAMTAIKALVWDFEDLGQQQNQGIQASIMQLWLGGEVAGKKISPHVRFVGTTNRRQDGAGVGTIIAPLRSRAVSIIQVDPDLVDWIEWAIRNGIRSEIIGYLNAAGVDHLSPDTDPPNDIVNFPSPRTWVNAHKVLELGLRNPAVEQETLGGSVGIAEAMMLMEWSRRFREIPNADTIILNPSGVTIPSQSDLLYMMTLGVARKATKLNMGNVLHFAKLVADKDVEKATLLVKSAIKRDRALYSTKAMTDFVSSGTEFASLFETV